MPALVLPNSAQLQECSGTGDRTQTGWAYKAIVSIITIGSTVAIVVENDQRNFQYATGKVRDPPLGLLTSSYPTGLIGSAAVYQAVY
jgi:hypothetical protein